MIEVNDKEVMILLKKAEELRKQSIKVCDELKRVFDL